MNPPLNASQAIRRLRSAQLHAFARQLWEFFYVNDDGGLDPDQDVNGGDLVEMVGEFFQNHELVPELTSDAESNS